MQKYKIRSVNQQFRRCGEVFFRSGASFKETDFTNKQWEILKAEPMLVVEAEAINEEEAEKEAQANEEAQAEKEAEKEAQANEEAHAQAQADKEAQANEEAQAQAQAQKPLSEAQRLQKIKQAMQQCLTNPDALTKDGIPKIANLEDILGFTVTSAERNQLSFEMQEVK